MDVKFHIRYDYSISSRDLHCEDKIIWSRNGACSSLDPTEHLTIGTEEYVVDTLTKDRATILRLAQEMCSKFMTVCWLKPFSKQAVKSQVMLSTILWMRYGVAHYSCHSVMLLGNLTCVWKPWVKAGTEQCIHFFLIDMNIWAWARFKKNSRGKVKNGWAAGASNKDGTDMLLLFALLFLFFFFCLLALLLLNLGG